MIKISDIRNIGGYEMNTVKSHYHIKYKKKRLGFIGKVLVILVGISGLSMLFNIDPKLQNVFVQYEKVENNNRKMKEILNNEEAYPEELVELALNKEETIDFVYNYIEKEDNPQINKINIKKDYQKGEFPLFIQWDERWGYDLYGDTYIAINGCGPTTLAMVIVGLTGDTSINPKVVAEYSYNNNYYVENVGTKWELMTDGVQAFGIQGEEIPLSKKEIIGTLEKGQPIIASMKPGHFTTSGHFILLTGVTEDGEIIINDSDSRKRSSITWDIDTIMDEAKGLWKFYL